MSAPRTIIVHCHLFKNAGSTLDWSLRRNFGDAFLDHRDNDEMRKGAAYLGPFLESHPHLSAISSHHVRLPLPEVNGARLLPAFLIRHPIERAYSVYAFERVQPDDTPGGRMAKQLAFPEYVRMRMQPGVGATLRDFQVRRCSTVASIWAGKGRPALDEALRTLEGTPLLGIVDLFDESMVLFEDALRPHFPDIDLAYVAQNTGRYDLAARHGPLRRLFAGWWRREAQAGAPAAVEERARRVLEMLDAPTARLLEANNELDLALYRQVRQKVLERYRALDPGGARLSDFRSRCEALRRAAMPAASAG